MIDWPNCPSIYEINTWVWLHELRQRYRRDITLGNVPPQEWDTLAGYKFDAVWLMGVWDPERGDALYTLAGHTDWVFSVAWSPDGRTLASASGDKMIRLWDPPCANILRTLVGHTEGVFILAWSLDGRMLASGAFDHTIRLWETETGKELRRLEGHSSYILDLAWASDGRTMFQGLFEQFLYPRDVDVTPISPVVCPKGHRQERATVVKRLREGKKFL